MPHNTTVFCIMYINPECTLTTFPKLNVFNCQGNLGEAQIEDFPSSHCCFSGMIYSQERTDEIIWIRNLNT